MIKYKIQYAILSSELSLKWAKIREHFKGYAHCSSVKFSKLARDMFFLKFFTFFVLVDTAHLLILGSFFELKVRIIHEKIRYAQEFVERH